MSANVESRRLRIARRRHDVNKNSSILFVK
jgi:hypothetical protein